MADARWQHASDHGTATCRKTTDAPQFGQFVKKLFSREFELKLILTLQVQITCEHHNLPITRGCDRRIISNRLDGLSLPRTGKLTSFVDFQHVLNHFY